MKIWFSPFVFSAVFFVLGCIFAVFAEREIYVSQQKEKNAQLRELAQSAIAEIKSRFALYEYGLRGARGEYVKIANKSNTQNKFLNYTEIEEFAQEFPGSHGIGFIRRVRAEEKDAFLSTLGKEKKIPLEIKQLTKHQGDFFIVERIEPEPENDQTIGIDLASDEITLQAVMSAVTTGKATLSSPCPLLKTNKLGFLFLLPVYRPNAILTSPENRLNASIGLVFMPLDIEEVFKIFDRRKDNFFLALYEGNEAVNTQRFFTTAKNIEFLKNEQPVKMPLTLYNQSWLLEFQARSYPFNHAYFDALPHLRALIIGFFAITSVMLFSYLRRRNLIAKDDQATFKQTLLEYCLDAIITINGKGRIIEFNKIAESLFGYRKDQVINQPLVNFLVPAHLSDIYNSTLQHLTPASFDKNFGQRIETRALRATGEEFPIELMVVPEYINHQFCLTGFVRDLTAIQQTMDSLTTAQRESEQANLAKTFFLATVSHEIKTPLSAIIGMNDLLSTTALSAEQIAYVKIVQQSGISLLSIVNDVLDFSKMESCEIHLDLQKSDLLAIVDSALAIMGPKAAAKNLELYATVEYPVLYNPILDPGRVRQVLINLIDNAIKFTERGHIEIRLSHKSNKSAGYEVLFTVSDSGIGISDKDKETVFQNFTKTDPGASRKFGGMGLGLAICNKLVALFGGEIGVHNNVYGGSDFWFCVPTITQIFWQPEKKPIRSMVLQSEKKCIKALFHQLQAVSTENRFIESLDDISTQDLPSVLFVDDSQLAKFTAKDLETLKSDPLLACTKVLITELGQEKKTPKWLEIFQNQLCKPIQFNQLNALLDESLGVLSNDRRRFHPLSETSTTFKQTGKGRRILLVEDSPANQLVVEAMLVKAGYRVDVAENGAEGIKKSSKQSYDAILMDINLPVLGGLEATERIRYNPGPNQKTPIIAITASSIAEHKNECIGAGMNGFLTKPLSMTGLQDEIEKHLKQIPERQNTLPLSFSKPETTVTQIVDNQVLERLKHETSPTLFPELLNLFLDQGSQRVARIVNACERNDFPALKSEIHSLKSESATFGAAQLSRLASQIDASCKLNDQEKAFNAAKSIAELWSQALSEFRNVNQKDDT